MGSGELDALWESLNGRGGRWVDSLTEEQSDWLDTVAAAIVEKGREPVWASVIRAWKAKWPDTTPNKSTISTAIRDRVAARG